MKAISALGLMAGVLMAGSVFGADAPANVKERVCSRQDLIGHTWKLMKVNESPHRKELSFFKNDPYQYLTFYNQDQYGYLASNAEMKPDALQQQMLYWPKRGKHTLQYRLSDDGVLDLYMDGKVRYRYRCMYVVKAHAKLAKRDLRLNGYSTQYKAGKVYKLYRFWY